MKRSKMVELIAEDLLEAYGGDQEEREEARAGSKMARLKTAHLALKSVEKFGMTPPQRLIKFVKGTDWAVAYPSGIEVRTWEKESHDK